MWLSEIIRWILELIGVTTVRIGGTLFLESDVVTFLRKVREEINMLLLPHKVPKGDIQQVLRIYFPWEWSENSCFLRFHRCLRMPFLFGGETQMFWMKHWNVVVGELVNPPSYSFDYSGYKNSSYCMVMHIYIQHKYKMMLHVIYIHMCVCC